MKSQAPQHEPPQHRPGPALAAAADPPPVADAESVRIFEEEVRNAVSYEKGLAVKALIALAVVALVVAIRVLFLA